MDAGPNDLLNFPEYTQVEEGGGDTVVDYRLDVPAGQYRVEFFSNTSADASGNGEGQMYLGFEDITSFGPGPYTYEHTLVGVTNVDNLAMTATKIDGASPTGFGVTSEFGGATLPIVDLSLSKQLLNPNEVARGATVDYSLVLTNEGPDSLDLTQHSQVFNSPPLLIDFAPPDLIAANQLSETELPGTFWVSAGNPDLTCFWAGPASGGLYLGISTSADHSLTLCWYTGDLTELASGSSLSAVLSFTVSNDSSLVFTNHAIAGSSAADPDAAAISDIFTSGNDILEMYIASAGSINNFASAPYPLPAEPDAGANTNSSSPLAAAGTNEAVWLIASFSMLITSAWLLVRLRKNNLSGLKSGRL